MVLGPFYIVSYYIGLVKTSWTDGSDGNSEIGTLVKEQSHLFDLLKAFDCNREQQSRIGYVRNMSELSSNKHRYHGRR